MKLIDNDSPLGRFLGTIADIVLLNLLFLVCSLPVVTMGASFCAMDYVFLKKQREPHIPVVSTFFSAWKQNFKKGTLAWLLMLAAALVIYTDCRFFSMTGPHPYAPLYYMFLALAVIFACPAVWLLPVIASFENKLSMLISQAFFFAVKKLPQTLFMAALWAACIYYTFANVNVFIVVLSFWIFFGFGLLAWIDSRLMIGAFLPYMKKIDTE